MAEFCLKCFNEVNHTHYTKGEVCLEDDFCEGCGEWKPCVMELRPSLWQQLLQVPRKWVAIILGAIILIAAFLAWYNGGSCVLCDSFRYHAPVLIDLEQGKSLELGLYEPHETNAAELAEVQTQGETFSLIQIGSVSGYRDTTKRKIEINVPADVSNKIALCRECRQLLNGNNARYVLADLHSEKKLIAIQNGSCWVIRCYEISMIQNGESISVVIQGTLTE